MKLSNLTMIFVIIMLPIMIIVSYYISLQIDTINIQTSYNAKLLDATKSAIQAFEINTVEWNDSYSTTANSKRRDTMASINTFLTSLANSMGTTGMSREELLTYVPAILTTLYDGYYIYTPSETKEFIRDDNGVGVVMSEDLVNKEDENGRPFLQGYNKSKIDDDKGKLLYKCDSSSTTYKGEAFTLDPNNAKKTYTHMLKPFATYSARYYKNNDGHGRTDIVVNYTLDNYITIYGEVQGKYVIKSGYLTNESGGPDNYSKWAYASENLTENVYYKYNGKIYCKMHTYVYASDNTKVYFDGDEPFIVSATGERTNLSDLKTVKYKKIATGMLGGGTPYVYQALNYGIITVGGTKKYINKSALYIDTDGNGYNQSLPLSFDLKKDYSVRNYGYESFMFTNWVNSNLKNITIGDMQDVKDRSIYGNSDDKIFVTNKDNNDPENQNSIFVRHKNEVIKQVLISNLGQAITGYSHNSEGDYKLPVLTEEDWNQILRNVSIVTFVQGIPIGMKYYNNYVVATSTANKEYVNPNEIYVNDSSEYYHLPYCSKFCEPMSVSNGYRNIDYIPRYYNDENGKTIEYYKHSYSNNGYTASSSACYYCIVQRDLYQESTYKDYVDVMQKMYNNALSRERYVTHEFKDIVYLDEKEKIEAFNGQFTPYQGKITGAKVKELIEKVNKNNLSDSEHQVWVYSNSDEINNTNTYSVLLCYTGDDLNKKWSENGGGMPGLLSNNTSTYDPKGTENGYIFIIFIHN